jgi:hypothetical protein
MAGENRWSLRMRRNSAQRCENIVLKPQLPAKNCAGGRRRREKRQQNRGVSMPVGRNMKAREISSRCWRAASDGCAAAIHHGGSMQHKHREKYEKYYLFDSIVFGELILIGVRNISFSSAIFFIVGGEEKASVSNRQ